MLYDTYQVHSDVLAPIRLMAEFFRGVLTQPWPLIGDAPLVPVATADDCATSAVVADQTVEVLPVLDQRVDQNKAVLRRHRPPGDAPVPSLLPLDETGHFYFAQTGHSHFAATVACGALTRAR